MCISACLSLLVTVPSQKKICPQLTDNAQSSAYEWLTAHLAGDGEPLVNYACALYNRRQMKKKINSIKYEHIFIVVETGGTFGTTQTQILSRQIEEKGMTMLKMHCLWLRLPSVKIFPFLINDLHGDEVEKSLSRKVCLILDTVSWIYIFSTPGLYKGQGKNTFCWHPEVLRRGWLHSEFHKVDSLLSVSLVVYPGLYAGALCLWRGSELCNYFCLHSQIPRPPSWLH